MVYFCTLVKFGLIGDCNIRKNLYWLFPQEMMAKALLDIDIF